MTSPLPPHELTDLTCPACERVGEPSLFRGQGAQHLGAYCKKCKTFIKWAPQTSVWLALAEFQAKTIATYVAYGAVPSKLDDEHFEPTAIQAIAAMARACWANSGDMGFHDNGPRSVLELSMLIVTECAELAEWDRHNRPMSDHLPQFTGAEEELADILVRVFDHSVEMGVEPERLGLAFVEKLRYNRTRGYRHGNKSI